MGQRKAVGGWVLGVLGVGAMLASAVSVAPAAGAAGSARGAAAPATNGVIAFASQRDLPAPAPDGPSDLYVVDLDGGGLTNLTQAPEADDFLPAWSPDGTRLAFTSDRDGDDEIYVADYLPQARRLANLRQVTVNTVADRFPVWVAGGTRLVLMSTRGGFGFELWELDLTADDPDATAVRRTFTPGVEDCCASASPDGGSIVYASLASGDFELYTLDLTVPDAEPVNLTRRPSPDEVPFRGYDGTPTWASSGAVIYRSLRAENGYRSDLFAIDPTTGVSRQLTTGADARQPAAAPDGTAVAYASGSPGEEDLWVFDLVKGEPRPLVAFAGADRDAAWQPLRPVPPPPDVPDGPDAPDPPVRPDTMTTTGYRMVGADGTVYAFGEAVGHDDAPMPAGAAAVDIERNPGDAGYWVADDHGRVSALGGAPHLGDASGLAPGERVTSLSATPTGAGYWLFTDRGRALPFGDAPFLGDLSGLVLNGPVLDSTATPSGLGYYLVAADGGVFTFGDAAFHGSMGATPLNEPVRSLVADPDGIGYWLVAGDGGVFAFDAAFRGAVPAALPPGGVLNAPVVGMVAYGNGYLMVGADGGAFVFADLSFVGSLGDTPPAAPIVAIAAL